ncbi:protein shisa-like-2A [Salvelinus sp. IW2-2015]|uniref:protein shisa-like-2A n=1 Tax=Salvelinus sp. IW2-2015 TaxID=2691554 RepID=UPI000CDF6F5F|nr:protein shisa-like-2A [Salvelinus alpinus]
MSGDCTSYYNAEKVLVNEFMCPKPDNDAGALFCCGFNDMKYCCDDPNSFFPYEYGYMWWLSLGALVGLSIAAVVLLAFIITVCVLCYLFIATKPRGLDNGLPLIAPGAEPSPREGPSRSHPSSPPTGPQGFKKHFLSGKLDCDNQPPDPDRLFQRCFMATVTTINVEGSS